MSAEPLEDGLVEFYSSQADLILSQYENINRLLGPTTDWTHPGTHCEVLIRDFLRRHLLPSMSVDKGYVFGRASRADGVAHGPEVDILIHDTGNFRPVFRLEDFVIVQPEAVLGMIQVKRTLRAGKDASLEKGVRQIVDAKQHLLGVMFQNRIRKETALYGGDASLVRSSLSLQDIKKAFTAVVGFEDGTGKSRTTYSDVLQRAYEANPPYLPPGDDYDPSIYALPDVVVSLKGVLICCPRMNLKRRTYYCYDSICDG